MALKVALLMVGTSNLGTELSHSMGTLKIPKMTLVIEFANGA
jgi:hypothetical protein